PRLRPDSFRVTSPPDRVYNCVAWAVGVTADWWWPHEDPREAYSPPGALRVRTLQVFRATFASLGYTMRSAAETEPRLVKVADFADPVGVPSRVARQRPSGRWTSKLGGAEDIEHDLHDLEGELYGTVALVMKRPLSPVAPNAS